MLLDWHALPAAISTRVVKVPDSDWRQICVQLHSLLVSLHPALDVQYHCLTQSLHFHLLPWEHLCLIPLLLAKLRKSRQMPTLPSAM